MPHKGLRPSRRINDEKLFYISYVPDVERKFS
jgi:hypothetical protein